MNSNTQSTVDEVMIPKQLHFDELRFIKLAPRNKNPIEKDWNKSNNYQFNDPELQEHLKRGGNYGVACGHGNLVVIDSDSTIIHEIIEDYLPRTLTVKTGRPGGAGTHYYFQCDDIKKPVRLTDPATKIKGGLGDIQWRGKQVVGPDSIHPSGNRYEILRDLPIRKISIHDIRNVLGKWMATERKTPKKTGVFRNFGPDINVTDLVDTSTMIPTSNGFQGSHPIHGSDGGVNFSISPEKNCWYCFRHDTGGGPIQLIAMLEGVVDCCDAGSLDRIAFKLTMEKIKEKYE